MTSQSKGGAPVQPNAEDLSEEELEYYSRQIVLPEIGYNGQLKLKNAKVCIVGLGGLGSPTALQLTAMGVGHLRLVDRDIVELSNLHRQHLYSIDLIGYPKVEAAARRLKTLNPNIEIEPMPLSLNIDTAEDIIKGADVVIDGLDRMTPRYAINRACVKLNIPYVFGAVITTTGNASTIIPGKTPCLECFYGNIDDDKLPTCAVVGVHPSVIGVIASIEVAEAVKIITGKQPSLANKLLLCDIANMTFEEVHVSKSENCPVCGLKPKGTPMALKRELFEEICGRSGKRVCVIIPRKNLELNMEDLYKILKRRRFNIKVKSNLGTTFNHDHKTTATILKSGIMIIEGVKNKEKALNFYSEIIVDGLNFTWSAIQ
jgi:molybdopterin/thiamine biosynthesis adenylyltransferase